VTAVRIRKLQFQLKNLKVNLMALSWVVDDHPREPMHPVIARSSSDLNGDRKYESGIRDEMHRFGKLNVPANEQ
jgi:hypothetical protein